MSNTTIINIQKASLVKLGYNNLEEWIKDPNNVYIGRHLVYVKGTFNSKWRNPYSISKDSSRPLSTKAYPVKRLGREECIKAFREMLMSNPKLLGELEELKGKTLGCWCKPEACHGDVLIEILNSL